MIVAAADKLQLVDGSADLRARSTRLQLAREPAAEISGVARRVPPPSPADQAMVASEMSEIGELGDVATLRRVSQVLHCAVEEQNSSQREMACWAVAAFRLNDRSFFEEAIPVPRTSGRVPRDGKTSAGKRSALPARFNLYGRAIQERLVIPYLAGELR